MGRVCSTVADVVLSPKTTFFQCDKEENDTENAGR